MKSFTEYIGIKEKVNPLLEKLAEIEHDQCVEWSKSLAENEDLSPDRIERWKTMWVPYDELTEEQKDQDRIYANKVIDVITNHITEGLRGKEIFIQGKALQLLSKGRNEVVMELIKIYGSRFRKTIEEFESRLGRLPTPDDLIWVAGIHTGKDPRFVAKQLIQKFNDQ